MTIAAVIAIIAAEDIRDPLEGLVLVRVIVATEIPQLERRHDSAAAAAAFSPNSVGVALNGINRRCLGYLRGFGKLGVNVAPFVSGVATDPDFATPATDAVALGASCDEIVAKLGIVLCRPAIGPAARTPSPLGRDMREFLCFYCHLVWYSCVYDKSS
jgi:hypothetical protein